VADGRGLVTTIVVVVVVVVVIVVVIGEATQFGVRANPGRYDHLDCDNDNDNDNDNDATSIP
jgi:hypothetical protein